MESAAAPAVDNPTARAKPALNLNQATGRSIEVDQLVDDAFEYQAWDTTQIAKGRIVRLALAEAVRVIIDLVPPSADRSAAIRKIREARMDCNSAITHRGRF